MEGNGPAVPAIESGRHRRRQVSGGAQVVIERAFLSAPAVLGDYVICDVESVSIILIPNTQTNLMHPDKVLNSTRSFRMGRLMSGQRRIAYEHQEQFSYTNRLCLSPRHSQFIDMHPPLTVALQHPPASPTSNNITMEHLGRPERFARSTRAARRSSLKRPEPVRIFYLVR